ncbi:hypothetical protein SISSUDRAFT_1048664 [Sistotremastrum suecicum HHB10207 ss-3]|uniref:Amino acid transporter transmembrane domain-containing protein n=1 Tax=Sistotremastrum suecicum HHB10207 ss-3 TaxID=1314776 RepID=A0A166CA23_9AGAM|nr:hypothetical protein SISSUDRAFT_1048664 [Sistotremastrum suecicum HHB10207 ss-3]
MTTTLLGLGLLAKPLAFAISGWIMGCIILTFYGSLACYTALIIGRLALSDPTFISYPDIARKAWGPRSVLFVRVFVCVVLFSYCIVLVILYADSIHAVFPIVSLTTYKLLGLIVFIPTVFLPLHILSYTSILGMLSVFLVIFVILFDGLVKSSPPGSLWSPESTDIWTPSRSVNGVGWEGIGVTCGLFMAGLASHAIIPELVRDMKDPSQFESMIKGTFFTVTIISAIVGASGYLMFGRTVSGEISQDLLHVPDWPILNELMNRVMVWSLVITPLTKFALCYRPVNTIISLYILPKLSPSILPSASPSPSSPSSPSLLRRVLTLQFLIPALIKISLTLLAVLLSILLPSFASMVALLGSIGSTLLTVHGPLIAKIALERAMDGSNINGRKGKRGGRMVDMGLVVGVGVLSMWGLVESFKRESA